MAITDRYHILRALADGEERHGYALMEAVEAATHGKVILAPGTLYRAIDRLQRDGLIAEEDPRPAPDLEDERRQYYRITARGQALLAPPGTPFASFTPPTPPSQSVPDRPHDEQRVRADGQERHGVVPAVAFGATWGAVTGGLLLLLGAGGAGWVTGAVATVVTTGAGLLRRPSAA